MLSLRSAAPVLDPTRCRCCSQNGNPGLSRMAAIPAKCQTKISWCKQLMEVRQGSSPFRVGEIEAC